LQVTSGFVANGELFGKMTMNFLTLAVATNNQGC
jgi:hypothetical protein